MPSNCTVFGCFNTRMKVNTQGLDIRFFRFPRENDVRDAWIQACRRSDQINPNNARVCSVHFAKDDITDDMKSRLLSIQTPKNQRILKIDAVPSLFMPKGKIPLDMTTLFILNT